MFKAQNSKLKLFKISDSQLSGKISLIEYIS